ncbi:hypothetical protein ACFQY4_20640 [Catellatospora bangladeshensis]|uniref:SH3 domain-containing protein n=1 Tax=Catellatospora bangladeshensis TaxID=310355 RepID=A0A8J3JTF7_9ACTN|nr:hypothetical protein [Catellatospora bangladeshensis]GIF82839.1 hypothetical protein Cba03nite_41880 [Catellatospora bangladeshensis]
MSKFLQRIGVGSAAVLLAIAGGLVVAASPASAAVTCGPPAPDKDGTSAQVINSVSGYVGPAMRTGPGHNCSILVRPPWGAWLPMNCYRYGDSVNGVTTWTAVHYNGYFGWVSDYHLSGYGSMQAC